MLDIGDTHSVFPVCRRCESYVMVIEQICRGFRENSLLGYKVRHELSGCQGHMIRQASDGLKIIEEHGTIFVQ